MSHDMFGDALTLVLKFEGGYVDHPRDPGGATKYGIIRATLGAWRGRPVAKAEVMALTLKEAGAIYRARYWDAVAGDDLPAGLDAAVFDFAVNSGPARAIRILQAVLGVARDGRMGPVTLAAAQGCDVPDTIRHLSRARLGFLGRLPTWATFGRGWQRRVTGVETAALMMAHERAGKPFSSHPAPVPYSGPVQSSPGM